MNDKPLPIAPFAIVIVGFIASIALAIFSFGVLLPLSALLLGLTAVLVGFWVLLNRESTASRILAAFLIFIPAAACITLILRLLA